MPKSVPAPQSKTRGAAKAQREAAAAAKPQTRSKGTVPDPVAQNDVATTGPPAKKPRKCVACSALANAFVPLHKNCPLKQNKVAAQGEIVTREENLAADVQAKIALILAKRDGAPAQDHAVPPITSPAFPPGLGLEHLAAYAPPAVVPGAPPAVGSALLPALWPMCAAIPIFGPGLSDCNTSDAMQVDEIVSLPVDEAPPSTPGKNTRQAKSASVESEEHPPPYASPEALDASDNSSTSDESAADESPKKKTHIPNAVKTMNDGDWQEMHLTRNKKRPEKLAVDKMSHAVNPKFQAIVQKAEFMSDKVDSWVICAAMPMHGLGELRMWENEDLVRDTPDIKDTLRDVLFNRLEPLREQRLAEMKAESKANKAKAAAAEAAARESEGEKRKYKARVDKLEKESKRLKAVLAAKSSRKASDKKKRFALKQKSRPKKGVQVV